MKTLHKVLVNEVLKECFFKFLTDTRQRFHFNFSSSTKLPNFEPISGDEEFFNTELGETVVTLWPYVER